MLRRLGFALTLAACCAAARGRSQEPAENGPVNRGKIEAALKLTADAAGKYSFELDGVSDVTKLLTEPVLRWSNPAVGEIHGNVFLWTVNNRPAVVGSLYKWFTPHTHTSHEFHSLAETPLLGRYEGADVWRTREPGLRFLPLDDAPPPGAAAAQRLLQMRRLASQFSVTKIERDGSQQELRLLSQPIYRYSASKDHIQEGGLFVFVQGTDPEVFLLLEARGPGDAAQWLFAAARMNGVGFQLRRRDQEIWSVEIMRWADIGSHAQTYTTFRFENVARSEEGKAAP
jgi:hypothetical protein